MLRGGWLAGRTRGGPCRAVRRHRHHPGRHTNIRLAGVGLGQLVGPVVVPGRIGLA